MSFLKEIFEAFKVRLRSPWMGSIMLAVLLWNWKGIAILVFEKGLSITERVGLFDTEFQWYDLLIPVLAGFGFSLAKPWVNTLVDIVTSSPSHKLKLRNINRSSELKRAEIEEMEHDDLIAANAKNIDLEERLNLTNNIIDGLNEDLAICNRTTNALENRVSEQKKLRFELVNLSFNEDDSGRRKVDDLILDRINLLEVILALFETEDDEDYSAKLKIGVHIRSKEFMEAVNDTASHDGRNEIMKYLIFKDRQRAAVGSKFMLQDFVDGL